MRDISWSDICMHNDNFLGILIKENVKHILNKFYKKQNRSKLHLEAPIQ